ANIQRISNKHKEFARSIVDNPKLREVRQTGTILVMEWETGGNSSYLSELRNKLYLFFLDRGIIMRPLGNTIYILPPYVINDDDLDYIYTSIHQALNEL
ncbi:MAG: aminotransferase class III-fold pyridoxal phosphate-dependent enzyme, partial [Pedobacter sp.]